MLTKLEICKLLRVTNVDPTPEGDSYKMPNETPPFEINWEPKTDGVLCNFIAPIVRS